MPSVGLDPVETAEVVADLCRGGSDFIKDDERQADAPLCPFEDRLAAVFVVLDRHSVRTGRRPLYASTSPARWSTCPAATTRRRRRDAPA